jgi:hypothetical protein
VAGAAKTDPFKVGGDQGSDIDGAGHIENTGEEEHPMIPAKTMFLEIGRKRFQIASFEEASCMFCMARDKMGEGASRTPSPKIVDERGEVIGHVSYNGRVWAGATYVAGASPLFG